MSAWLLLESLRPKQRMIAEHRNIKIVKATEQLGGTTVLTVAGRKFRTSQGTAFTLCEGRIVGETKGNGSSISYSIPALDVIREYLAHANKQDALTVKVLAADRLNELG